MPNHGAAPSEVFPAYCRVSGSICFYRFTSCCALVLLERPSDVCRYFLLGWPVSPERTARAFCPWGPGPCTSGCRHLGEWMEPGPPVALIGVQAASQSGPSPSAVPGVLCPEVFRVSFPREQSFGLLVQGAGWVSSCCSGEEGTWGLTASFHPTLGF